jgi:hypothetical protein
MSTDLCHVVDQPLSIELLHSTTQNLVTLTHSLWLL